MALQNPIYKNRPIGKILTIGSFLLLLFLAAVAAVTYFQYRATLQESRNAFTMVEIDNLVSYIKDDLLMLTGSDSEQRMDRLRKNRDAVTTKLEELGHEEDIILIAPLIKHSPEVTTKLKDIRSEWQEISLNIDALLEKKEAWERLSGARNTMFRDRSLEGNLFRLSREVGEIAVRENEQTSLIEGATQLDGLIFRILRNAEVALSSNVRRSRVGLEQLQQDILQYRSLTTRLLRGDAAAGQPALKGQAIRAKLGELLKVGEPFESGLNVIVNDLPALNELIQVLDRMNKSRGSISDEVVLMSQIYSQTIIDPRVILIIVVMVLFILLTLFYMVWQVLQDLRGRKRSSEFDSRRNQDAILKLLEETMPMSEGDLTVRAAVDEAITGAIADALNFMLEEMSAVIRRINSTADQVTQETETVQEVSERLYLASQKQNQEIKTTANTVLHVTQSIGEVAEAAAQSANVAQQSLGTAGKGAEAVRSQIDSMSEIRAQIQETAKRIKRLGDSSLEIGEIVNLISDITDQTNVLALNAAIQAASAGEAGRGFAVVAEEVQRLAERSAEATKQISAIVKMIQADTQDAVSAMERSTSGVVEGTRLSEEAGEALADIERVSNQLADLIRNISRLTHAQAMSVDEVRTAIESNLKATEMATQSAEQTATSVSRLTQVAAELRAAVSGFKV
ncbi:MAG: methyl-accepting chemotaxis protein [Burkholderiales bacterium]|jgi:twitching motility protein PilJ|nr:methyl-accepting chemotaxis protein [Burkholderiales bacterium]